MNKPVAPRLDNRVAFDAREVIDDGVGNVEGRFVQQFECWAGFTFLRGTEAVIAARLEGRQPVVVRVRRTAQTSQIQHDWQMRDLRDGSWVGTAPDQYWDGPVYAVRSVIPSEDGRWLDVTVESGVGA